jgi:hypothetical protein
MRYLPVILLLSLWACEAKLASKVRKGAPLPEPEPSVQAPSGVRKEDQAERPVSRLDGPEVYERRTFQSTNVVTLVLPFGLVEDGEAIVVTNTATGAGVTLAAERLAGQILVRLDGKREESRTVVRLYPWLEQFRGFLKHGNNTLRLSANGNDVDVTIVLADFTMGDQSMTGARGEETVAQQQQFPGLQLAPNGLVGHGAVRAPGGAQLTNGLTPTLIH